MPKEWLQEFENRFKVGNSFLSDEPIRYSFKKVEVLEFFMDILRNEQAFKKVSEQADEFFSITVETEYRNKHVRWLLTYPRVMYFLEHNVLPMVYPSKLI